MIILIILLTTQNLMCQVSAKIVEFKKMEIFYEGEIFRMYKKSLHTYYRKRTHFNMAYPLHIVIKNNGSEKAKFYIEATGDISGWNVTSGWNIWDTNTGNKFDHRVDVGFELNSGSEYTIKFSLVNPKSESDIANVDFILKQDKAWSSDPVLHVYNMDFHTDDTPPSSSVNALPQYTYNNIFKVYWISNDDGTSSSGVWKYDVRSRVGSGTWQSWLSGVTYTDKSFIGSTNQTIYFESIAYDNVGNKENYLEGNGDTHTTILAVAIENEELNIPKEFKLYQNYPNPFNASTTIKYDVSKHSKVIIKLYNIYGQEIETLIDEEQSTGSYRIKWIPKNIVSGIYIFQLKAGNYIETKKLSYLK